jgi:TonB family protein
VAVPLTLKVFKGDELVATKQFDRDIIKIGRLSSAHLSIEDEKVSRIHAVIDSTDGSLSIIDMGSVEGTYVNGKRVNKGALAIGDEIKLGNTVLKLEAGAQAAATAPVADDASEPTRTDVVAAPQAITEPPAPAVVAAPVAAPPPAPVEAAPAPRASAPAIDPSFASTSRHVVAEAQKGNSAVAYSPQVRRKSGGGPLGLELRFMWGASIVGEYFMQPGQVRDFTIGSAQGVDFVMGESKTAEAKFSVVKGDQGGFHLRFTDKMKGELHRNGEVLDLKKVLESGKAGHEGDAYSLSLDSNDFAWVDVGGLVLEVCFQPVPKPIIVPFTEAIDFTVLNIFLVMFFIGSLFVITAENRDLEGDQFKDDLSGDQARIAKLIIKPPDIQKNSLLEKLAKQKASGEMAAKHRGDEGQMGKKDGPKVNRHAAPKGDPNNKDVARMMTAKIFGSGSGGISTVFGHNGLGGELKAAMGNMFGAAPGDAAGMGGLGLRGSGSGGGGVGDTIGIGGIGTKGRGGGTGSYGTGVGVLGGKKGVDIGITSSEPLVMGSLDKELIRQVIHRNRNQIRYCYESQLQRYPKLNGKVAVKFVISASGAVASSSVAQATTNNAELETCVAGRVRTWMFPKPKGGGVVIVTYPFLFKQSGE